VYFNCKDVSYLSRDNKIITEKLKDHIVDFAHNSTYMYSTLATLCRTVSYFLTRSQAVARIAHHTASQHLWGDYLKAHMLFPIGGP